MSIQLTQNGTVLQHQDRLLSLAAIFQIHQRYRCINRFRLLLLTFVYLLFSLVSHGVHEWILIILFATVQVVAAAASSQLHGWVGLETVHFSSCQTHRQLFGAKTTGILHLFTRSSQVWNDFLVDNLLFSVGYLLFAQLSLNNGNIFEQMNGALSQEFITFFQIVKLLVTTGNIVIDYWWIYGFDH